MPRNCGQDFYELADRVISRAISSIAVRASTDGSAEPFSYLCFFFYDLTRNGSTTSSNPLQKTFAEPYFLDGFRGMAIQPRSHVFLNMCSVERDMMKQEGCVLLGACAAEPPQRLSRLK